MAGLDTVQVDALVVFEFEGGLAQDTLAGLEVVGGASRGEDDAKTVDVWDVSLDTLEASSVLGVQAVGVFLAGEVSIVGGA